MQYVWAPFKMELLFMCILMFINNKWMNKLIAVILSQEKHVGPSIFNTCLFPSYIPCQSMMYLTFLEK